MERQQFRRLGQRERLWGLGRATTMMRRPSRRPSIRARPPYTCRSKLFHWQRARSNVCLLRGFGSTLTGNGGYPSLQVQNTSCTSVTIETLNGGRLSDAGERGGQHGYGRAAGLSIAELHHIAQLERGGNVFLEDVSFEPYYFSRENVWAHQLNPENQVEHVLNDGGQLCVLGLKTENPGSQGVNPSTILESRNGVKCWAAISPCGG